MTYHRWAEHLHDDILDMLFQVGWVPLHPQEMKNFFDRLFLRIIERMGQADKERFLEIEQLKHQRARFYEQLRDCYADQVCN